MVLISHIKKYTGGLRKAAIGLAVFGFLGWLVWVSTVQATKVKDETISDEQEFEKTEVVEPIAYGYREGALLWRLTGLKAVEIKETQESTVDRIYEMTFFKEGEPNLYASGDTGYWDKSREKLILRGNVRCESADETTILETEEMIWYEKTDAMECPKPIELWVEDNHITSNALYSDKDMVVLEFIGNVKLFIVGLEGESFITKEEVFPMETVDERKKAKKGIIVECEYLFYNKETKYLRCYPKITRTAIRKHSLDEFGRPPQFDLIWDPLSGRTSWAPVPTAGDDLPGASAPAGDQPAPEEYEVQEIGKAMGWNGAADTAPPPSGETAPDEDWRDEEQYLIESPEEYVPGRVFAHQDEKVKKIWCDFMEIFLDAKKIKARGDVRFEARNLEDEERPPRGKVGKAIVTEYTWVDADYMNYYWDDELVDAWGGVHGWQDEKDFVGMNMTYSDNLGIMVVYGDVLVKQFGGRWLGEHEILEDIEDEDAREDAQKPTRVYSNSALSYTESDWSFGWGDVLFEQKDQKIRGKRVEYDDSTEIMVMYDDVQFKNEDGEWMIADKLTMDFYLENYLVEGAQSKARMLIPEEYKDDLEEWEKEREGIVEEEEEGISEEETSSASEVIEESPGEDNEPAENPETEPESSNEMEATR